MQIPATTYRYKKHYSFSKDSFRDPTLDFKCQACLQVLLFNIKQNPPIHQRPKKNVRALKVRLVRGIVIPLKKLIVFYWE